MLALGHQWRTPTTLESTRTSAALDGWMDGWMEYTHTKHTATYTLAADKCLTESKCKVSLAALPVVHIVPGLAVPHTQAEAGLGT